MTRRAPTHDEAAGQFRIEFGRSFPVTAPAPRYEQLVAPIDGTNQGRYARWMATEDGQRVFNEVRVRALTLARRGEERIGIKRIVEGVRADWHVQINNVFTALIARDLVASEPELRDLIELRERRAA